MKREKIIYPSDVFYFLTNLKNHKNFSLTYTTKKVCVNKKM